MSLRHLIFALLLVFLLKLPHQESGIKHDPWLEMEKGLKLCGVENILYQTSCFISDNDGERLVFDGVRLPETGAPAPPKCAWSMQAGYENEERLLKIYGNDRQACGELWRQLASAVNSGAASDTRTWSVEAYKDDGANLMGLGRGLIETLGGSLQSVYVNSRTVQLLAYLPWAGEGLLLDEERVNLHVELYNIDSSDRVRIRLGIPLLLSTAF